MGFTVGAQNQNSKEDRANVEFKHYFACGYEGEEPLIWYKKNAHLMPTLSKVATKYLQIPASSAASERLFSKA